MSMSFRRPLQVLDLAALHDRHSNIIACSAVSGAGLLQGFDWMVNDIKSRIFLLE